MTDITTVWNPQLGHGDWAMSGPDLQSGGDLATAILISLFTDRVAQPGYQPPAPSNGDPEGWWGDAYLPAGIGPIGSRIWQLRRAVKTQTTLNLAQDMAAEALQWLINIGAVARFSITAWWLNGSYLAMRIVAIRPNGTAETYPSPGATYAWVWNQPT